MNNKIREFVSIDAKKFAAYTVAGAAAALAGTQTAEADICHVTPGADFALGGGLQQFALDGSVYLAIGNLAIGTAGTAGFLGARIVTIDGAGASTAYAGGLAGFSIAGAGTNIYNYASNFATASGGPATSVVVNNQAILQSTLATFAFGIGYTNSQFTNQDGYFAFSFDTADGTQFGWGRVDLISGPSENTYTLAEYAFTKDVGEQINVGQTAVPEPSALGLLALGAVGVLSSRRKRLVA